MTINIRKLAAQTASFFYTAFMRLAIAVWTFLLCFKTFLSLGQAKVTFIISKVPAAKQADIHLFAAGEFNNWNPADPAFEFQKTGRGSWQLVKTLAKGIRSFKITRGSWQNVECAADGGAVGNRTFTLGQDTTIMIEPAAWADSFRAAEKKHTAGANVHIISENFGIPQLERQRRIWIYLPRDYAVSDKKYPVIYMQDGQNLFDQYTSAYGEWGIDEFMDKLSPQEQCIIVGIDHGGQYRIREYDPYDSKYGKGQGKAYLEFLVGTLKPYVDRHYRTRIDPGNTTIAGSSMGGLISMYAILRYPGVFGNAGVFSPSLWIAPELYSYAARTHLDVGSRFYFVCGDSESSDMVTDMQKMVTLVRSRGVSAENSPVVIVKGASHNEQQWQWDFPGFYTWLFRASKSP